MHKRTAHRFRLSLIMVLGIVFALGSFWLTQLMHNGGGDIRAGQQANEPDYIIDNFSFVRMTPGGQPRYVISGTRLTHRPVDDSADIEQPVVQSLSAEQPPMTVQARRARIEHANSELHLLGDVNIERAASKLGKHMQMKTEALTILPDDDVMLTDQPVVMLLGDAMIRGTGMRANNATRQLHFDSKGQIMFPPKAAP